MDMLPPGGGGCWLAVYWDGGKLVYMLLPDGGGCWLAVYWDDW